MNDEKKTKEQLMNELAELRQRITKLEESNTEWGRSEKELMDNSLDSIMFTETVGYITKVNKHFLELLGYREEEVVGKFVAELTPMNEGETYESVTGELLKIDRECLDGTMTLIDELLTKGKVANWEAYYLRKDKKLVPIEQNIVCLYDEKGERTGAVSIIRDITDRRQAEKELERYRCHLEDLVKERTEKLSETKDYLDNIIASSLDCIVIADSIGKITRVNESFLRLIGYQHEEVIGRHVMELSITEEGEYESTTGEIVTLGEELFEEARKIIYEKLFEEGKIRNWNTYYFRKDRKIIPIEQNISYLYNKEGDIIGSVGITRDITDRKQQEEKLKKAHDEMEVRVDERTAELKESNEQLQQEILVREKMEKELIEAKEGAENANRAKSEFLANMSHEFRTPLNHIIGFTELVVDKNFGDLNETQEEYLGDVLQSSKHLLLLINDILDLSKVEAGKLELKASGINARTLIDNSLIMFKEKSLKHGIELYSNVDHVPETIMADERKLKQILYNLLSNAMKFTPDGGKVCLSAELVDCIVRPDFDQEIQAAWKVSLEIMARVKLTVKSTGSVLSFRFPTRGSA